jgi:hypothetical protein
MGRHRHRVRRRLVPGMGVRRPHRLASHPGGVRVRMILTFTGVSTGRRTLAGAGGDTFAQRDWKFFAGPGRADADAVGGIGTLGARCARAGAGGQ